MKMKKSFLILSGVLIGSAISWAQIPYPDEGPPAPVGQRELPVDSAEGYSVVPQMVFSGHEITLKISDQNVSDYRCDYTVRRLEYFKAVKLLVVDLESEPCRTEQSGKNKAVVKWVLPKDLRGSGEFDLMINQAVVGKVKIRAEKALFDRKE